MLAFRFSPSRMPRAEIRGRRRMMGGKDMERFQAFNSS
jgi:hypothetical protein